MLPRFPCGSIRNIRFAFGKCYGRVALNRFLVALILIETRVVLIMKVSPGVNIYMRWVFNVSAIVILLSTMGKTAADCPAVENHGGGL